MASGIVYVGGEIEAAGFRLAGVSARIPRAGDEAAAFEQAHREATVVLMGAACARAVPRTLLEAALAAPSPLVAVLPEPGGAPRFDPSAKVRRLLGVEA